MEYIVPNRFSFSRSLALARSRARSLSCWAREPRSSATRQHAPTDTRSLCLPTFICCLWINTRLLLLLFRRCTVARSVHLIHRSGTNLLLILLLLLLLLLLLIPFSSCSSCSRTTFGLCESRFPICSLGPTSCPRPSTRVAYTLELNP